MVQGGIQHCLFGKATRFTKVNINLLLIDTFLLPPRGYRHTKICPWREVYLLGMDEQLPSILVLKRRLPVAQMMWKHEDKNKNCHKQLVSSCSHHDISILFRITFRPSDIPLILTTAAPSFSV